MKSIKLTLVAAALASPMLAQAAPVFYNSEAAFLAAAAGYTLAIENFDSYNGALTRSITNLKSGLNISSNVNLEKDSSNRRDTCASTTCLWFLTPRSGSSQTFSFDIGGVNAFGIFLDDLANVGATELTFKIDAGATQRYSIGRGLGGTDRYFGVVDNAASFLSVTMTNVAAPDNPLMDGVFIDNVRWGADSKLKCNTTNNLNDLHLCPLDIRT